MLLRVYRLTDRLGMLFVKMSSAFGDWLLDGASVTVSATGGVFSLVAALLMLLLRALGRFLRAIGVVLRGFVRLILRGLGLIVRGFVRGLSLIGLGIIAVFRAILRLLGRSSRVAANTAGAAGTSVTSSASGAMARRAARTEMDVTVVQDPLKIQNRRLSVLVLVLGVFMVGVVLYATDPNRSVSAVPVANAASGTGGSLLRPLDGTPPPAEDNPEAFGGIATPIPTATQIPQALQARGNIAYVVRERGQTDIWTVGVGDNEAYRIINNAADDRDPAWAPDGRRMAFASHEAGNWEIYLYDMDAPLDNNISRLTYDLSFQSNPQWSPDGQLLVYESYQGGNLDIFAIRADGTEAAIQITTHEAPDFSPIFSPNFAQRMIAFVSWREGNQDIYLFDLDTLTITNLTQTPLRNEDHPAWSPDGNTIAFSAWEQGSEKVFVQDIDAPGNNARVVSFGREPSWSPDGGSLTFAVDATDGSQSYLYARPMRSGGAAVEVIPLPYGASSPTWSNRLLSPQMTSLPLAITEPLYTEAVERRDTGAPFGLRSLGDVQTRQALLSDQVNDSFEALRDALVQRAGRDFLGVLDDAFWEIDRRPQAGEERRNWHMTGRAFSFRRDSILGFPPPIEVVREDVGIETLWRVYLRVDDEFDAGQLGEPLRRMPWDFAARTGGDVEAYNQGGRLRANVPQGYYIDLTQLAEDYGWSRRAAGNDWRSNSEALYYWMFLKGEGLSWVDAMLEIYQPSELGGFAPTPTPAPQEAG